MLRQPLVTSISIPVSIRFIVPASKCDASRPDGTLIGQKSRPGEPRPDHKLGTVEFNGQSRATEVVFDLRVQVNSGVTQEVVKDVVNVGPCSRRTVRHVRSRRRRFLDVGSWTADGSAKI